MTGYIASSLPLNELLCINLLSTETWVVSVRYRVQILCVCVYTHIYTHTRTTMGTESFPGGKAAGALR